MRKVSTVLFVLFILTGTSAMAQRLATFEVQLPKPTNGLSIPVSVNIDEVTFVKDSMLSLVEVVDSVTIRNVPCQIQQGDHRILTWNVNTSGNTRKKRVYRLIQKAPAIYNEVIAKDADGALTIQAGNRNLLQYHFQTVYPPTGIDTNYKRSGFIHPLWTPKGQE